MDKFQKYLEKISAKNMNIREDICNRRISYLSNELKDKIRKFEFK